MLRALQKKAGEDPTTWDEYLTPTLWAYRINETEFLGYSPFFLLYGREATLQGELPPPGKIATAAPPTADLIDDGVDTALKANATKGAVHLPAAKGNLLQAQAKQKRNYRKRRAIDPEDLAPVGSYVYLKKAKVKGKLVPKVEGPYKLVGFNNTKTTAYIQDVSEVAWAENVSRISTKAG